MSSKKYKFKWEDGTELEFDPIVSDHSIHLELGEIQGRYRNAIWVIVSDINWQHFRNRYQGNTPKEKDKIRICKLRNKVACLGFPAGTYLPYKQEGYAASIFLKGLTGDLIIQR